jgi:hypothetical protein
MCASGDGKSYESSLNCNRLAFPLSALPSTHDLAKCLRESEARARVVRRHRRVED